MKNNKSFQTPSSKPNDVTYRLGRLQQTLTEAEMFLRSIDPGVFPEQHGVLADLIGRAASTARDLTAPPKRPRKSDEEKAARAAAKEAERAAKAEASARRKAAAPPAKERRPVGEVVAPTPVSAPSGTGPLSAIERALAAAKARKAAREAA